MQSNRYLIINADDFGLNSGVNRAVIETHANGIVTSASIMVNCPASKEAAEMAKQNPNLGIGLHINLTQGKPISGKINSLTDPDGFFLSRAQLELKSLAGKIISEDIVEELHLQWDMLQSLGLPISHIDSHQHIHVIPKVFKMIAAFAKEKDIALRIPLEKLFPRMNAWPAFFNPQNIFRLYRKIYLHIYAYKAKRYAKKLKVPCNKHFFSIFGYWPPVFKLKISFYEQLLRKIPEGISEIMCHPAHYEQNDQYTTSITHISQQEVLILQDPALKKIIKECNIQLINYNKLKELSNG
ncbi:carbohydrate deacetylase [Candidatus Margulisiibacteriota bacterium]